MEEECREGGERVSFRTRGHVNEFADAQERETLCVCARVFTYVKRGSSCSARWKNRRAVSCSFCRLKQLPRTHQASGDMRSMAISSWARYLRAEEQKKNARRM